MKKLLEALYSNLDEGIVCLDKQMQLLDWNKCFEQMNVIPMKHLHRGDTLPDANEDKARIVFFNTSRQGQEVLCLHQILSQRNDSPLLGELQTEDARFFEIRRHYLEDDSLFAIFRDVSEKRQIESVLSCYQDMVSAARDWTAHIDLDYCFEGISQSITELFGQTQENILGQPLINFYGERTFSSLIKPAIDNCIEQKKNIHNETWLKLEGRARKFVMIDCYPCYGSSMEPNGVVMSIHDLTQQKIVESERDLYESQLASLASEITLAEEKERRRISADLHDRVAQNLGLMKIKLGRSKMISEGSDKGQKNLEEAYQLLNQIIDETRLLMFEISPPILYAMGLVAALEWLAEKLEQQTNIQCEFIKNNDLTRLDEDTKVILYQITQEMMTNIRKHSYASTAKLTIGQVNNNICITIQDNGIGFDVDKVSVGTENQTGYGLFSVGERLKRVNGHLEIISGPNSGTTVYIHVKV